MVENKDIPIHELKYYHGEKIGFVFTGVNRSSDDAIQRLCENLKSWGVTEKDPLFYTRVEENSVAFVFSGDSNFRMTDFYQACSQISRFGFFEVDTLYGWLTEHFK